MRLNTNSIVIVAHDAGAANHIFAWLKTNYIDVENVLFCVEGPAATILAKQFPELESIDINDAMDRASMLISGTGWQSNLEYNARRIARDRSIKSIAVIDHWVNYRARFLRCNNEILPDEIWVVDDYALNIAKQMFPGVSVTQHRNDFLNLQLCEVEKYTFKKPGGSRILFVMEPIRQEWGQKDVPGEIQALRYFIDNMSVLQFNANPEIIIKPHPSDVSGKYQSWITDYNDLNIVVDEKSSLSHLLAGADIVVGCQTYAMVIALAADKRVISSLPPGAPKCALPHKGIIHLSSLLS